MGYKVLTVAIFLCFMKPAHVRAQCSKPNFEGNVVLSDKDISTNEFPDGSKVTFVCITGYVAVGGRSRSVTCNGNKWTELALSCTRKSCGSLPDIINGRYEIPNGILFGDSVTGVCNTGYTSSSYGTTQRTCRADGWDGRDLECEAVQCQSPQAIENGQYDMQEDPDRQYEYGDGVYYKCNDGFSLIGSDVIKCSDDGEFHPEPPKCIVVSCPTPIVPNGNRIGGKAPPYGLNNYIHYRCNDGYEISGQDHITCTANGWSSEPPQCIGYCDPPVFEGNVIISKAVEVRQKYYEGTSVTFECKSGYKQEDLKTSNETKCVNKKWTPLDLTCKGQYCKPPVIGRNVTISKPFDSMTKFLDGSNVTIECKSGYEPVDSEAPKFVVTCKDTTWSQLQFRCKGQYCKPPVIGRNVTISKPFDSMTKFLDGSNVTIECKSGYEPVDSEAPKFVVTCKDTTWSQLQFRCKGYCGPPALTGHVIAIQLNSENKYREGSSLELECEPGYKPVDSKTSKLIVCEDTNWKILQFTCTADSGPCPPHGLSPGAICGIVLLCVAGVGIPVVIVYLKKKKTKKFAQIRNNWRSDKKPSSP